MNPSSEAFFSYLDQWHSELPQVSFQDLCQEPQQLGICSVDLINGFCTIGALASPRVQAIVDPVVRLITNAWNFGVRSIVFSQDTHEPDALEFADFAPHCIRGTIEADTVPELKALPFYSQIDLIQKNSIHSGLNTGLMDWLVKYPDVQTFLVVGDCTDLCIYQLAMHLKLDANVRHMKRRVVIPADCVQTYDLPVDIAQNLGIYPHPGDLLHSIFLYHLALNGVEVVQHIC